MRSFKQVLPFLFFHILLWFSTLTSAVPAGTKNNPKFPKHIPNTGSKVGVELDYQLAEAGGEDVLPGKPSAVPKLVPRLVFMAHWTVPANTITDMQLAQICIDGYHDMVKNAQAYDFHAANYPTVMTAFLSGTDLIIASSQKGGVALTYTKDNGVGLLVEECLKNPDDSTSTKSNGGKCGEMSAAQIWQRLHPNQPIAAAKITTVSVKSKDGEVIVWAPCTEGPTGGGCDRLVGPGKVMDREVTKAAFDGRTPGSEKYDKSKWRQTPLQELSFAAPVQQ